MGGPRITTIDDGEWQEVRRIGFADGRTASVHERWLDFSPGFSRSWPAGTPG